MIEVVLEVPDDMLVALKLTPERFCDEVRLAAAAAEVVDAPPRLGVHHLTPTGLAAAHLVSLLISTRLAT